MNLSPLGQPKMEPKAEPKIVVNEAPCIRAKKVHPDAILPTRGTPDSAAIDLYSIGDWDLRPRTVTMISTGIAMAYPKGHVALIRDRSGMASKGITLHYFAMMKEAVLDWFKHCDDEKFSYAQSILGGVVDSDYRGEWKVLLYNATDAPYHITKGDRIAQVVVIPIKLPAVIECAELDIKEVTELDNTVRGEGGLGSTGK